MNVPRNWLRIRTRSVILHTTFCLIRTYLLYHSECFVTMITRFIVVLLLLLRLNATKDILQLGILVSQGGDLNLSGYIPAMQLALESITNDTTLPFDFDYTLNDSRCLAAPATRSFIHQVSQNENQIMLIGSDCSVSTEPVAELTPHWNIVQISPTSTSPRLSNKKIFPHFLRSLSSEAEIVVGIIQAMKQFQWSRIAMITQSENLFTFIATELKEQLTVSNLQLVGEFTFNSDENPREAVNSVRGSHARIIFVNMYQVHGAEVICQAYKNGMFYPEYVWMFFDWYLKDWWVSGNPSCIMDGLVKSEDLERFLIDSLSVDHFPRIEPMRKNETNIGNITWNQYLSEHKQRFPKLKTVDNTTGPAIDEGAFIFDAIWTAALALNKTETRLNEMNLTLLNFTYEDKYNISDIIYEEALNVTFFGLTGEVYYKDNGDRPGQVRLLQYRATVGNGSLEKVRFAQITNGTLVYVDEESYSTVYPDGAPQDEEHIYISLLLFVVYTIIAIIGIIFAVICLAFNLWFREQRLVKLSSPHVNTMIIAGAVVFYVIVILFGVDENVASHSTVNRLCHARIWLVAIGFSLLYGTIFAKTWRVYYIFNHSKPNSNSEVTDVYLFGIVGTLVAVDIVFMLPLTALSSSRLRREYEEVEGNNANDLPQIMGVCTSDDSFIWLPILFVYKGFLLLAGLFLAFETRKVKIKSLNDSRFIVMSVYEAVIVSGTLSPIGFLLQSFPNVQYAIIGIMILFSISLILGLVFVTKWYKVYKDPKGTRSLEKSNHTDSSPANNTNIGSSTTDEGYYKSRIQELNQEIKDLSNKNKILNDKLSMFTDVPNRNKEVATLLEAITETKV